MKGRVKPEGVLLTKGYFYYQERVGDRFTYRGGRGSLKSAMDSKKSPSGGFTTESPYDHWLFVIPKELMS